MRVEFNGLNKLTKKLNNLQENAGKLNGTHEVPLSELFSTSFMSKNTNFSSFETFFAYSSFKVNSEEEFDAIPEKELDTFVSTNTCFNSWNEMHTEAAGEWTIKQLGL
uniref:hypothetical protein n=1 Tax=uncultured Allobacillus sp. TaxID=1638025 RepID=UPI00259412E8|nr:hypothetical protein [uncultured Allobacillus sp.]